MTAQQIYRQKVYGNFRKRGKPEKRKNSKFRENRPGMSADHLKLIRKLPCCVPGCNVVGCDPHHLQDTGARERGMGLRSTDRWAIPLCRLHHDEVHSLGSRRERQWFEQFGMDPYEVAISLWTLRGDAAAMTRVIIANKGLRK